MERQHRTWDLETSTERVPGGLVLIPKGRIGSVTAARFAEALFAARTESSAVIVDLASVDYISGLGVTVLREAATNGSRMIVCGLREPVRITLELGQALSGVIVKENRDAAIEWLNADC